MGVRTYTSPENTIELLAHHHRPHEVAGSADSWRRTAPAAFPLKLSDYSIDRNESMGFGNEFSEWRNGCYRTLAVVTKACGCQWRRSGGANRQVSSC